MSRYQRTTHEHLPVDPGERRVTVRRDVYDTLVEQAAAWRELRDSVGSADALLGLLVECPSVRDLLMGEYADWCARKEAAESSHAISAAGGPWKGGPSHAELVRRRMLPGKLHDEHVARHGEYLGGPVVWETGRPVGEADGQAAA